MYPLQKRMLYHLIRSIQDMENFIHKSVRLSCDINRAMRMFLVETNVRKWLDGASVEHKIGGNFMFDIQLSDEVISLSQGTIISKEFEKLIKIKIRVPDKMRTAFIEEYSVIEFNFMQGTSRTEFCTEIHLLHRGLNPESSGDYIGELETFWANKMEKLRYLMNGDWVIEDRDLNRSFLMGGRL